MVPLERLERSHQAPEAGALSTELQGRAAVSYWLLKQATGRDLVPAAIASLSIRIVDGEAATHLGFNVVYGRPFQTGHYFLIHHQLDATLIEHLIGLARSIVKSHAIMDFATATLAPYENANASL